MTTTSAERRSAGKRWTLADYVQFAFLWLQTKGPKLLIRSDSNVVMIRHDASTSRRSLGLQGLLPPWKRLFLM